MTSQPIFHVFSRRLGSPEMTFVASFSSPTAAQDYGEEFIRGDRTTHEVEHGQVEALPTPHLLPSNTWTAEIEVRRSGAQGVFEWTPRETRAEKRDVIRRLLDDLHYEGFETRGVRGVRYIGRPLSDGSVPNFEESPHA